MSLHAPARAGRRTVVILGALSALAPLALDMYLPGLPALTRQLGAPAATGQLTLTACLLGLALGQLVAGPLSDAAGRRVPLLAGMVAYVDRHGRLRARALDLDARRRCGSSRARPAASAS